MQGVVIGEAAEQGYRLCRFGIVEGRRRRAKITGLRSPQAHPECT
jgi:hypothetical protein